MEVLRFIFSSFWVWLGAVVLVAAAGEAVAGIIKAIRQPRKSPYTARATSCAWKSKERETGTLKPRSKRRSGSKRCRDSRRTRNECGPIEQ